MWRFEDVCWSKKKFLSILGVRRQKVLLNSQTFVLEHILLGRGSTQQFILQSQTNISRISYLQGFLNAHVSQKWCLVGFTREMSYLCYLEKKILVINSSDIFLQQMRFTDISTIHLSQEGSSGNNISLFSFFVVATKRHMWKKGEGYANISSKKRLSCILSIKIKIHQMWIEHKTNMGAALWPCFFCPWNRSHNGNVHRNCQGDNSWSRNKIKTLRMQRSWKDCLHFFTVGAIHALLTNHIEPLRMKPTLQKSLLERKIASLRLNSLSRDRSGQFIAN